MCRRRRIARYLTVFGYKKRSYEEACMQFGDLFFWTTLLQMEEDIENADWQQRHNVKWLKQKQAVMFTDICYGSWRCLLHKSWFGKNTSQCYVWSNFIYLLHSCSSHNCLELTDERYNMYVESPNLENPRCLKLFLCRFRLPNNWFVEVAENGSRVPILPTMKWQQDRYPLSVQRAVESPWPAGIHPM